MIGLMIIAAFAIYLAISYGVVRFTIRWARRTGRGVKRWTVFAVLVMYLLVFWDHIPTLVLYKYYCHTKAGFWVYKTPEQWKAENPGVAETLLRKKNTQIYDSAGNFQSYKKNERFDTISQVETIPFFPLMISVNLIIDINTNDQLAKIVYVSSGYTGSMELYKFWTKIDPCVIGAHDFRKILFNYQTIGRETK